MKSKLKSKSSYNINDLLSLKMPYACVLTKPKRKPIEELWAIQPIEGYKIRPNGFDIIGYLGWDIPEPGCDVDGMFIYVNGKAFAWIGLCRPSREKALYPDEILFL